MMGKRKSVSKVGVNMKKIAMLLIACLLMFTGCSSTEKEKEVAQDPPKQEEPKEIRVSFLAVGDNLIHNTVYWDPNCQMSDGSWNYEAMYEPIKPYLEGVDVKNINQETPLGGRELGLSNYPMFNGPAEIGTAVVQTGFNWVSQASNHALDAGEAGILNQVSLWDEHNIMHTGMNRSQEEADALRIMEVNGMKIGLLNYTYGLNGLSTPSGKEYLVNVIDEAKIKADIAKLKPNCDVMIASMHWGQEYQYQENEEQRALAQMLSDEGVSVIIGAHPHVIEPATYLTSKDGNKTLVYYSLGNFISSQDSGDTMLGGMAKWNIVMNEKTRETRIEEAQFYPTVTQFNSAMQDFHVYLLQDYSDDLASKHYLANEISRQYFIDLTNQIMGTPEGIEILY